MNKVETLKSILQKIEEHFPDMVTNEETVPFGMAQAIKNCLDNPTEVETYSCLVKLQFELELYYPDAVNDPDTIQYELAKEIRSCISI